MKHAVITGGTGGLGSAIAEALRQPNWSVEALGRRDFDLQDQTAISSYFKNRPVDLLVCAAGITRDAPISRLDSATWDETFAVNFTAARLCAAAVIPEMQRLGAGHIVFISSYSAIHPPIGQSAYSASKAALLGLTNDLSKRHGRENIRVNVVLPGFLETPMTSTVSNQRRSEVLAAHRLGRFNTPAAVGAFITHLHHFLPHTSGQVFQLDSRG